MDSSAGTGGTPELESFARLVGVDQRVVAVEDNGEARVLWFCATEHLWFAATPQQVRPLVEERGAFVPVDRKPAMAGLEELKARSTTQYRDEMRPTMSRRAMIPMMMVEMRQTVILEFFAELFKPPCPGIMKIENGLLDDILPPSDAPTALAMEPEPDRPRAAESSPKRKHHLGNAEAPPTNSTRAEPSIPWAAAASRPEEVPVPTDELVIDDVFVVKPYQKAGERSMESSSSMRSTFSRTFVVVKSMCEPCHQRRRQSSSKASARSSSSTSRTWCGSLPPLKRARKRYARTASSPPDGC